MIFTFYSAHQTGQSAVGCDSFRGGSCCHKSHNIIMVSSVGAEGVNNAIEYLLMDVKI